MAPFSQAAAQTGLSQWPQLKARMPIEGLGKRPFSHMYTLIHFSGPGAMSYQSLHATEHALQP